MSERTAYAGGPEFDSSQPESIFPLVPSEVVSALGAMQVNSNEMIQLITAARAEGRADDIYVGLASSDLAAWHEGMGDFSLGAGYLYRAGLLYGTMLAGRVSYYQTLTDEPKLDNPVAFANALAYLHDSYRGLDDSDDMKRSNNNWRRQKQREVRYTGSDVLTIANAGLNDRVLGLLEQANLEQSDQQAFHVGLVDSVIFFDAYARFRAGKEPVLPSDHVEYLPAFDPVKHRRDPRNILSDAARFEFESIDEITHNIEQLRKLSVVTDFLMTDNLKELGGHAVMVQFGPNAFTEMFEVTGIRLSPYHKRTMLIASMGPFIVDVMVHHGVEPLSMLSLSGGAILAAINAGVRRKERQEARTHGLKIYR